MNWDWRLFLDYLDVLEWPVLIGIAMFLFKKPLAELIRNIKTFKQGNTEVTFEKQAADAVKKVEAAADITAQIEVTAEAEVTTDPGKPMEFQVDSEGELAILALFLRHPQRVARVAINNNLDALESNSILHALTLLAIATGRKMEFDGYEFLMSPMTDRNK